MWTAPLLFLARLCWVPRGQARVLGMLLGMKGPRQTLKRHSHRMQKAPASVGGTGGFQHDRA